MEDNLFAIVIRENCLISRRVEKLEIYSSRKAKELKLQVLFVRYCIVLTIDYI